MNRRALPLIVGLLLLPLGCGGDDDPTDVDGTLVLEPAELCSGSPGTAIVTFEDANLEEEIRLALSIGAMDDLTCDLVSGLTSLDARNDMITSVVGIQNLTGLTDLDLSRNEITDVGALVELTALTDLDLSNNPDLTDIQPLIDNTGLGAGDVVDVENTKADCADVALLEGKGVTVFADCP